MPELPDVEIFRRYLDATSLHQSIEGVRTEADVLKDISVRRFERTVRGKSFEATRRHGKYAFVSLGEPPWLLLHFGMTGFLKYYKNNEKAPSHVRVLFTFHNGYHLAYSCQRKLGKVRLVDDPDRFVRSRGLGPDALAPDLDADAFKQTIRGFRGSVKSALMNQQLIAGIGNIYSDEILYQTGIFPKHSVTQMDEKILDRLYETVKEVLVTAIDVQADPERLPNTYIIPQRHGEGRCPGDGSPIERLKVSGRSSYYCPQCQSSGRQT
ncbi:MAG: DNA-formamidopyrimidine glycosylase family protein [Desulfobacterales bacterium]